MVTAALSHEMGRTQRQPESILRLEETVAFGCNKSTFVCIHHNYNKSEKSMDHDKWYLVSGYSNVGSHAQYAATTKMANNNTQYAKTLMI